MDDTLQLYRNAEYAASAIAGARLVRFEKGEHLAIIVEQTAIRALLPHVDEFRPVHNLESLGQLIMAMNEPAGPRGGGTKQWLKAM